MKRIFADTVAGRKNIGFGIALFVILGVVVGIPLTVDFLGGSMLTQDQYQTWKVIHGYGIFLAFINYFFGLCVDRLNLTHQQKEISSWSFLLAGLVGGIGRMTLMLLSALDEWGLIASLLETVLFVVGTLFFVLGQVKEQTAPSREQSVNVRYSHVK